MTNLLDHAHKSWVREEIARNLDRSGGSVFRRRSIPAARFRAAPEGDGVVTGYISTWEEYPIGPQIMERIVRGAFTSPARSPSSGSTTGAPDRSALLAPRPSTATGSGSRRASGRTTRVGARSGAP